MFCGMTLLTRAQGSDPLTAIQQRLQQRIVLAGLDSNGEIVTAGSVVTLQRSSLQMSATSAPANAGTPVNTYKNSKLSAGMFSWNLGLGLMKIDPNSIPMHTALAGEKFWIVHYNVTKNHVEFKIWTDPDSNNIRYWTWLTIPFDKKQIPSPDEFMNTLAEVLAVEQVQDQGGEPAQTQSNSGQPAPANGDGVGQDNAASVQGIYFRRDLKSDTMELGPNGVFALVQKGRKYEGNYSVEGETLTVWGPKIPGRQKCSLVGNVITDPGKTIWEKPAAPQNVAATPAAPTAPAAVTPVPQPPAQRVYDEVAPPPPPPAPAPTIAMGQTKDQVTAAFGEPQRKAAAGPKEIFFYTDLKIKVTFTGGKVSSID
jgi:hypothetical protein